MAINNESIGISAEVAIAVTFNVPINPQYVARAEQEIVNLLLRGGCVRQIFDRQQMPYPVEHVAEGGSPVDFKLAGGQTLSVKTNQKGLGRVAPQKIGQPTAWTYFNFLEENDVIPGFTLQKTLAHFRLADTYENRAWLFKWLSINYIDMLINMYWQNLFDCDYLLLFFNLDYRLNPLLNHKVFGRLARNQLFLGGQFTFTQTLDSWNESNTVKYNGVVIGNFQVHRNRDCFKFRFDMDGVMKVLGNDLRLTSYDDLKMALKEAWKNGKNS